MTSYSLSGQSNFPMIDSNYMDHIKAVQINPIGRPLQDPVIKLGKDKLIIKFDDLGRDNPYYRYTVIHCNRYWDPSDIKYNEYISGFENVMLEDSKFSRSTYQPYRHYSFTLPNQNMNLLISGNYLLLVYEEDSGDILFTRRFQVYVDRLKVEMDIVRPVFGSRYNSAQQIEFSASSQNFNIINPQNTLTAGVKQNGKWYYGAVLPPRSVIGNTYKWNYPGKPVFNGLREFRLFDARTLDSKKYGIDSILYMRDTIHVYHSLDYSRTGKLHHDLNDLNGQFYIDNQDYSNSSSAITSQYVMAHFILKHEVELNSSVYVVSGFTQWNLLPEARMKYNNENNLYTTSMFLKQGVYSYLYATEKDATNRPDFDQLEGNAFNTENSYQIFIYYSSISDRYDRLIGYLNYPQVRR